MIIFEDETGPYMAFVPCSNQLTAQHGTLHICDLNPQLETRWRLSRWERLKIGVNFILSCWWR